MTLVLQTQAKTSNYDSVKNIYTRLGKPTVSIFAEAFMDKGYNVPFRGKIIADGSSAMGYDAKNLSLKKEGDSTYLNLAGGTADVSFRPDKVVDYSCLTVLYNLRLNNISDIGTGVEFRVLGIGRSLDNRFLICHGGDGSIIVVSSRSTVHTFNESNGLDPLGFNRIAVHVNPDETLYICNGVVERGNTLPFDSDLSISPKRGVFDFDYDFLQIFEDDTKRTAEDIISYMDFIAQ